MAAFGQNHWTGLFFIPPRSSDKRMCLMEIANILTGVNGNDLSQGSAVNDPLNR
jgi:hypothetical protein